MRVISIPGTDALLPAIDYNSLMDAWRKVTNAILLLGHKPDRMGNIQEGVKRRADLAVRLYRQGVAPVIIPSGWYWPKDPVLRQFREAWIIERYLYATHGSDIRVLAEPYSTSIPENLLFTYVMFPNLQELTIVSGELFMPRTQFLASRCFDNRVRLRYEACKDGLSDEQTQQRLLVNAHCILQNSTLGDLLLPPAPDGTLQSKWRKMNEEHKNCLLHRDLR